MDMKASCLAPILLLAFSLMADETAPVPYDHYLRLFREDPEALRTICLQEVKRCNESGRDSAEYYKDLGLESAAAIKVFERARKQAHDRLLARAKKAARLVAEGKLVYSEERPKKGIRSAKGKFHMLYDLLELDIKNPEQDPDLGAFLEIVKTVAPGELTFAKKNHFSAIVD